MKKTIVLIISLMLLVTVIKAQKPVNNASVFKGIKVPGYCASGDTTRIPFFFQASISGFAANTKFKYYVSFIALADTASTATTGVGSDLLFKADGNIAFSVAPDFTAGNHDTLTIGSGGLFTGWFGVLTTNNNKFTAGRHLYPMIVMQEIKTGTPPVQKFYLTDSVHVLAFSKSAGANNGTAIYGNSYAKRKNLVLLYDDTVGNTTRPVSVAYVENDGNNISNMPSFYTSKVNGVAGAWGTIIPNTLANGIKRIETKQPFGGTAYLYANKELDATWGNDSTINPHGGVKAIAIRSDYAPLQPPVIEFKRSYTAVNEANTTLKLLVTRKYGNSDTSKVNFSLQNLTATQGADFTVDTTKQLIFNPYGNITDTISVSILADNISEATESLTLMLKKQVKASLGPNVSESIDIYDALMPVNSFFFKSQKVPQYCASGDTTRTPVVFQAKIIGFNVDTKYKYYVSYISYSDMNKLNVAGAGTNLFFKQNNTVIHSATPGFTAGNHDTITIPTSGEYLGWFGGLNTNDARFTAGKYVYPMIVIQEIDSIEKPIQRFYLNDSIKVLQYSAAAGSSNGTAIYGNSFTKSKNFVLLYDNILGLSPRPTNITYIESEGVTVSKMPNFYSAKVNGVAGAWGTIIPNTLSTGIKRFEVIDPKSFSLFEYANKEADATWGNDSTINPHGGSKPIYIKSDYAPLIAPDIQFTTNVTNVKESNVTIKLSVRRRYGNDDSTKVDYFVAGASATSGSDYTFNTGKTLRFKPYGDVIDSTTIVMNILDDNLSDPNENIAVKLTNPQNGFIGLQSTNTVTIVDNDTPFVSFGSKGIKVAETVGSFKLKVKIKTSPSTPTNIKLMVKYKGDSTFIPSEFKIGASKTDTTLQFSGAKFNDSMDVKIPIINDNFSENRNDTIILVLRSTGAPTTITKDSLFTIVITDDDAPPIYTFAKKIVSVKENAGSVKFRINIAGRNTSQSDINLKFIAGASSATQGKDLIFNPTTLIISVLPTDPDSIIVPLSILNDDLHESIENGVFVITNSLNAKIGKPDTMFVQILDDDVVEYPISRVTTVKTLTGVADSLNTRCKLRGVVYGVNLKPGGTPNGFLFTLIDPSGGLQVISSTGNKGYTVAEGDSIYVIGTIGQFEGMVQLQSIDSLIKLASGRALKPASAVSVLNESTESKLVKLNVVKLANPAQWPTTTMAANTVVKVKLVNQTDSFTLLIDSETDIDGTPAPSGFMNVTGLGGQSDPSSPFTSQYLIAPRYLTDIQNLATPIFTFKTATSSTAEYRPNTTPFVIQATNIVSNQQISIYIKGGTAQRGTSAGPGTDYISQASKTYILTPTKPFDTVTVQLNDDVLNELPETIIWVIRDNPYGTLIGADSVHTQTIVDNESVSVADLLAKETKMYPNPTKDILNISTSVIIQKVHILDVNGKVVLTVENIDAMEAVIHTENLAKGVYSISVFTERGVISKSFSKVE